MKGCIKLELFSYSVVYKSKEKGQAFFSVFIVDKKM